LGIEKAGIPVVQITAVPNVAQMVGISRILVGQTVTNVLGNRNLPEKEEKKLRRKYVLRALDILQMDTGGTNLFTLDGIF
jgi:glycine reductase